MNLISKVNLEEVILFPKVIHPRLFNSVGSGCGLAIDITFRDGVEKANEIAKSYTNLIQQIDGL